MMDIMINADTEVLIAFLLVVSLYFGGAMWMFGRYFKHL